MTSPPYDFGGRLTRAFPSQVIVDVTEVCNLACTHCSHPSFKKGEHYSGAFLDPALCSKLVDEIAEFGRGSTSYIRFTSNGEPLLHRQIFEMIADAKRRSGVAVALTTNGTVLDERRVETLLATEIDLVDVSIDAFHDATYAAIRVNGDLRKTRENTQRLIAEAQRAAGRTKVVVSFIEQPGNRDEVDDFRAFWSEQGADDVVVRRLHSQSGAHPVLAQIARRAAATIARRPCVYPWERIVLTATGHLSFCPSAWTHDSVLADYRATTVKDEWHGAFYQRLRRAHLDDKFDGFKFCGDCPDWVATRWPFEGRAYADMMDDFFGREHVDRG